MLSFDEMLAIAKEKRNGINEYEEYKDVILFRGKDDGEEEGGFNQPIIVFKTTGKVMTIPMVLQTMPQKIRKENKVSEGSC